MEGFNEEKEIWVDLGYFLYEMIHNKWQYHLFNMLKRVIGTVEIKQLINELYKKYPKGLVANVQKGKVPEYCKGLAKYLAKYVACPPIAVRRIVNYDGKEVSYYYQDHKASFQKNQNLARCWKCNTRYNSIELVMAHFNINFRQAVMFLIDQERQFPKKGYP